MKKIYINIYIYNLEVIELQEPTYRNSQVSWIFSKRQNVPGLVYTCINREPNDYNHCWENKFYG